MNRNLFASLFLLGGALLTAGCGESDAIDPEALPDPIVELNPSDTPEAGSTLATLQQQIFDLTNQARKTARTCGGKSYKAVPALTRNAKLDSAATKHSVDMATKNYFDHKGLDGSMPWDRMKREGYNYSYAGENIAAGNATAQATMTQWLNSAGHCANIMNPNFKELGVGYGTGGTYRYYWTQNFGSPL